ncbi:MAG: hypothetical protein AABN34_26870 [Acidobacteriota bacterium]
MVIEFTFSNEDFQIRHAQVAVFRMDALTGIKTLAKKAKEQLYRNEESIRNYFGPDEGEISGGLWRSTLSSPGLYRAVLGQIAIVRTSDRKEFTVPVYTKDFTIAEGDLEAGRYKIEISEPLFRIIVLDQNGQRVADRLELGFELHATDGGTEMTFELETDGNGEMTFLGDPSKYTPEVLDKPWLRIKTERLP